MKKVRVTKEQKEMLIEYMETHLNLFRGKFSPCHTREIADRQWDELTAKLNACGGAEKAKDKWRKTWDDLKMKVKLICSNEEKDFHKTGSGTPPHREPLPHLEQRVANLLGDALILGCSETVEAGESDDGSDGSVNGVLEDITWPAGIIAGQSVLLNATANQPSCSHWPEKDSTPTEPHQQRFPLPRTRPYARTVPKKTNQKTVEEQLATSNTSMAESMKELISVVRSASEHYIENTEQIMDFMQRQAAASESLAEAFQRQAAAAETAAAALVRHAKAMEVLAAVWAEQKKTQ